MTNLVESFRYAPYRVEKKFTKRELPYLPSGFKPTILGEPKIGMLGQHRWGLLHAYEFPDYWLIHKDEFNPETHPIEHLVKDAPFWGLIAGLAVAGITKAALDWIFGE